MRVSDNILGTRVEGSREKNEHVKVERCKLETTWWSDYGIWFIRLIIGAKWILHSIFTINLYYMNKIQNTLDL